jgi:hypothetical protein
MTGRLSPEREAELERHRVAMRNGWRIADDLGVPHSEASKVWESVSLEMKFYCRDFMRGLTIASYAKSWIETRNPFYIDAAHILCRRSGIDPPPTILTLMGDVSEKRFIGEVKGTVAKILKKNAKDYAQHLMANLYGAGATKELAASKAAQHLFEICGRIYFKASTLDSDFPEYMREIAKDKRLLFAEPQNERLLQEWQQILALLPEADEQLKGNRRE